MFFSAAQEGGKLLFGSGMVSGSSTFGVPIKNGVGFTAQEAEHREWSLSVCRTWPLGSVLLLAPLCMHVRRGFFWESEEGQVPLVLGKFSGQALPFAGSFFPGTLPGNY